MTAKPLTHAEIIRKLLARSSTKPTVTIEAMKDWTKISVTVPGSTAEQASERAAQVFDELQWKYNRPGFVPETDTEDVPFA